MHGRERAQRQAANDAEHRRVVRCERDENANVLVRNASSRKLRGTYAFGECHPREQHRAHAFDCAVRELVRASLVAVDTPVRIVHEVPVCSIAAYDCDSLEREALPTVDKLFANTLQQLA